MRKLLLVLSGAMFLSCCAAARAEDTAHVQTPGGPAIAMVRVYADDFTRSETFYHDVFGMNVVRVMTPSEHILMFPAGGVGLVLLLAQADTPRMTGGFLVRVPDIDAAISRVEPAGGAVLHPVTTPMANIRSALITDPYGSVIELMEDTRN